MRFFIRFFGIGLGVSLLAVSAGALVNNPDYLILDPGETLEASGVVYKNVSIVVQPGAGIFLPQNMTTDSSKWSLQLVAPNVYIGGTLCADGVSFNTAGSGQAGSGDPMGPGGSGFGATGGNGNANPGSGGYGYGPTYQAATGSVGINNPYGGGGSLRIDAMSLTITSSALLLARGSQYASHTTGGGSSGGSILINAIMTDILYWHILSFYFYPHLFVDGGPGQLHGSYFFRGYLLGKILSLFSYGGGGGAGGKIKFFQFPNHYVNYSINSVLGGAPGGGDATVGGDGTSSVYASSTPSTPALLSPDDGQTVGLQPTLNFSAADNQGSQFIKYWMRIYPDAGANTVNSAQWDPASPGFAGWNSVPFYKSGQMASYKVPWRLTPTQTYHWIVWATNNLGASWSASATRTFTTTNNNPPLAPKLLYPAPAQTGILKTPALMVMSADPDGNSLTFSLILSQDPGLSNPKIIQPNYSGWDQDNYPSAYNYAGVTATCQLDGSDALEPGTTYYWKATATDQLQESTTSSLGSFSIVPLPSTPALLTPANHAVLTLATPVLRMSSSSYTSAPLQYLLELSSDNFQTVMSYASSNGLGWSQPQFASGQAATLTIPLANALNTGQIYQWRVRAQDTYSNDWSRLSTVQDFTVITPPNVPQLLSPDNNYVAANSAMPFEFQAVSDAGNTLTYRFELSKNNFQTVLQNFDQGSSQPGWSSPSSPSGVPVNFTLPVSIALARGVPYQWRVTVWDGFSWSPDSETRNFSLAASLELQVSKIYPSPAISRQNLHVLLQPTVDADATLHLFNSQAKEIRRVTWHLPGGQASDYLLDISNCAPGAYFTITEVTSPYGTQKWVSRFAVVN